VKVTRHLVDGERLPLCGGVRVVHTPEHTPGHLSLFLELPSILISGDALVVVEGQLQGHDPSSPRTYPPPWPPYASWRADVVVCYQDGVYGHPATARLRELAGPG